MTAAERKITEADILPDADYAARRKELRGEAIAMKKNRRVEVGPFATFYFESYQTMWQQVHEMLRIEKGGKDQVAGELEAYNPLIPQGAELIATLMLEIEDGTRRDRTLRTTPDGKTSSVHWLRFAFTPRQIQAFKDGKEPAVLGFTHPNYGHMAVIPPSARAALAQDFD
jgi:Protein of unknown function (DUF3501)